MNNVNRVIGVQEVHHSNQAVTVAVPDHDPASFPVRLGVRLTGEPDNVFGVFRRDAMPRRVLEVCAVPTEIPGRHGTFVYNKLGGASITIETTDNTSASAVDNRGRAADNSRHG